MIDNNNKVAVVFGVRNDSSIAFAIALKLLQSGCKVALSYVPETREDVLYLMERNGFDTGLAFEADVRNEDQLSKG